jgi:hypothetical protein
MRHRLAQVEGEEASRAADLLAALADPEAE